MTVYVCAILTTFHLTSIVLVLLKERAMALSMDPAMGGPMERTLAWALGLAMERARELELA